MTIICSIDTANRKQAGGGDPPASFELEASCSCGGDLHGHRHTYESRRRVPETNHEKQLSTNLGCVLSQRTSTPRHYGMHCVFSATRVTKVLHGAARRINQHPELCTRQSMRMIRVNVGRPHLLTYSACRIAQQLHDSHIHRATRGHNHPEASQNPAVGSIDRRCHATCCRMHKPLGHRVSHLLDSMDDL